MTLEEQIKQYLATTDEAEKLENYLRKHITENQLYIADPLLPLWTWLAIKNVTVIDLETKYKDLPIEWIVTLYKEK